MASSSSAVGSSTSLGSSLAGASDGQLGARSPSSRRRRPTMIPTSGAVRGRSRIRAEVEVVVVVIVVVIGHGDAGLGATGAGRRAWPLRGRPWRDAAATGRPPRVACRAGIGGIIRSVTAPGGRGESARRSGGRASRRVSSDVDPGPARFVDLASFEQQPLDRLAIAGPLGLGLARPRCSRCARAAGRPRARAGGGSTS